MPAKLQTLAFNSERQEEMSQFYLALGANLKPKQVKVGSIVWQGFLGGLELIIYSAPKLNPAPVPQISMRFEVRDVEKSLESIRHVPGAEVLMDLMDLPDSRKAIVLDPDGHSVEIYQPWVEQGDEK